MLSNAGVFMEYIKEKTLTSTETIILQPKKSKIPLFWRWVFGILFCWLLLIPLIKAIQYNIDFATTEFAVTDKKVVEKYGWMSVHCDEMRLEKIENVTINQTFFGRMFNYGNVCIQGANRNNITFSNVKDVNEVKKAINNLL